MSEFNVAKPVEKTDLWLAVIDLEDFPDLDENTEDGQQQITALAAHVHYKHPTLVHFLIRRGGEEVGEMYLKSAFEQEH